MTTVFWKPGNLERYNSMALVTDQGRAHIWALLGSLSVLSGEGKGTLHEGQSQAELAAWLNGNHARFPEGRNDVSA